MKARAQGLAHTLLIVSLALAAACKSSKEPETPDPIGTDGPAENAGEAADEAVEDAADEAADETEDAADEVEDAAEEAKE
jgi:hypothetical protein